MKRMAVALTLIVIAVLSSLTLSFAYQSSIYPSNKEFSSLEPASSTTPSPSASSFTPNLDNSSSTSSSTPNPSQPESTPSTPDPTPTPAPTPTPNPTDIQLSLWTGVSDSNESLVIIDSPRNNTEYSAHTVTLTVHAAAPSWSYMKTSF